MHHNDRSQKSSKSKGKAPAFQDSELPSELDFFKYAQGNSSKRKSSNHNDVLEDRSEKRAKMDDVSESEVDDNKAGPSRQRVTAKGSDVPDPITSFKSLKDRYHIGSQILTNLSQYGYKEPTGIQSHGVPILMEVSYVCCQMLEVLKNSLLGSRFSCDFSHWYGQNIIVPPSFVRSIGCAFLVLVVR